MKFIILFLLSSTLVAQEVEIGFYTHHLASEGVNNNNQLIGVELKGVETATFINSFHDRSYSLGYRFKALGPFSVSAGVIHGYGENSKVFPVTVNDVVVYGALNVTVPVTDHLAVRGRLMGEVVMVNGVVSF